MARFHAALAVLLAASIAVPGCGIANVISGGPTWRAEKAGEVVARQRRWPAKVPPVAGAFDVERYRLRSGAEVLSFRNTARVERAFAHLLAALRSGGWVIPSHHGVGLTRAISGCGPDCGTLRFYATVEASQRGQVVTTLRVAVPGEFGRQFTPRGSCRDTSLAQREQDAEAARYGPVFTADLDRDGRLDGFVPRVDGHDERGDARIVWDAVVTRDDCAHVVGSFPAVPANSVFSPMGQRGLVDLVVVSRVTVQGRRKWITEVYRYDGARYVAESPRPGPGSREGLRRRSHGTADSQ